jgi:ketosteroid isomerase-like protein
MDAAAADRLVEQHFAFEAADDVDGVLATMAPDAEHHLLGSPWGPLHGHDAIRRFYDAIFPALRGTSVESVDRSSADGLVVDDSIWVGDVLDAAAFGLPGRSGAARFRLLHLFDVEGGLITRERVWPDLATLTHQLT